MWLRDYIDIEDKLSHSLSASAIMRKTIMRKTRVSDDYMRVSRWL
jgi:hypothetical protein